MLKGGLKGKSLNSGVEIVKKSSVGYSSVSGKEVETSTWNGHYRELTGYTLGREVLMLNLRELKSKTGIQEKGDCQLAG